MLRQLIRWLNRTPHNETTCRQAGHIGGIARREKDKAHYRSTAIKLANYINRPDLAEPLNEKRDQDMTPIHYEASVIAGTPAAATPAVDEKLRGYIERVERLLEEVKGIQDDIRDVYLESKSQGYDPKIMRQIVRLRKMQPHDRKEMEAILDVYKNNLGIE